MQEQLQSTVAPQPDASEVEVNQAAEETIEQPAEQAPVEDVPFPKKAVNAISRRDKQIGKLRAEMAALQAELEKTRTTQAAPQKQAQDGRPLPDDFEDYGSFLEALSEWKIEQKFTASEQKKSQAQLTQKEAEYIEYKEAEIAEKAQVHVKSIPDFAEVVELNVDFLDMMPLETQKAFYEADDAALAFYNLAKSGKLESLLTMNPTRAAMEIARAQGTTYQPKPVSNAPRPMTGVKGSSASSGSLENRSPDELMKWLKS